MAMIEAGSVTRFPVTKAERGEQRQDFELGSKQATRIRAWVARELSDTIPAIAGIARSAGLHDIAQHLSHTANIAADEFHRLDFVSDDYDNCEF
jgi:hypothetical protein